jgi:hypothetical protein
VGSAGAIVRNRGVAAAVAVQCHGSNDAAAARAIAQATAVLTRCGRGTVAAASSAADTAILAAGPQATVAQRWVVATSATARRHWRSMLLSAADAWQPAAGICRTCCATPSHAACAHSATCLSC